MNLEEIKGKCWLFNKTNINLETSLENKKKIVEENSYKEAIVETQNNPGKSILGILVPKNSIYFGLDGIDKKEKYPCPCLMEYKELSGLSIRSD
jgi:hypothetical protein